MLMGSLVSCSLSHHVPSTEEMAVTDAGLGGTALIPGCLALAAMGAAGVCSGSCRACKPWEEAYAGREPSVGGAQPHFIRSPLTLSPHCM